MTETEKENRLLADGYAKCKTDVLEKIGGFLADRKAVVQAIRNDGLESLETEALAIHVIVIGVTEDYLHAIRNLKP